MKICFKSLGPVKKEANQLRNLIKKTIKTKINPQKSLDIVSKMYGWQHFNELSYVFSNPGDAYPVQSDYLIKPDTDYRQINSLMNNERMSLEFRKRKILEKEIGLLHKDSRFIESILIEFFDSRSWLTKFMSNTSKDNTMMLSQFSDSTIKKNNLCIGADPEVQAEFYSKITASNAIENGGFYILRKSIADKFIPFMVDNMPKGEESRLKIVDTTMPINQRQVVIDLFKTETIDTIFDSIIKVMAKEDTCGSMLRGMSNSLLNAAKPLFKIIWGESAGALNGNILDFSFDFLSYSAFTEYKNSPELHNLRRLLSDLPAFNGELLYEMKEQSPRTYEYHAFLTMQFTELFMTMKEHNEQTTDFETVSIFEQFKSEAKNILIYVIKDDDICHCIDSLMFGAYLSVMSKTCLNDLENVYKGNGFKPVVLDYNSRYMLQGTAILSAQSRSSGYAYFYGMTDEACFKKTCELEAASIIANTSNRFIFKGYNEHELNFTRLMMDKRYGKVEFGKYSMLYTSSEFIEPDIIKIID